MKRYRKYNEFSGEIGDLMASTLANVLKSPFALFTSIPNFPLLSLVSCLYDSNGIIYLAFDNIGCGHYDAIVDASMQSVKKSSHISMFVWKKLKTRGGEVIL